MSKVVCYPFTLTTILCSNRCFKLLNFGLKSRRILSQRSTQGTFSWTGCQDDFVGRWQSLCVITQLAPTSRSSRSHLDPILSRNFDFKWLQLKFGRNWTKLTSLQKSFPTIVAKTVSSRNFFLRPILGRSGRNKPELNSQNPDPLLVR